MSRKYSVYIQDGCLKEGNTDFGNCVLSELSFEAFIGVIDKEICEYAKWWLEQRGYTVMMTNRNNLPDYWDRMGLDAVRAEFLAAALRGETV